ncbi:EAL domain-containing protein [Acidaminobacter sp. JC074]|uniref:putative bifunctional diguanylate cyclase/phosphodiesterase n=1 Tax=Acidaminobacter sp. JC074 TaxID=2530199 RepID=UPI001F1056C0|nr:GGDEF domain-containing phosphodiesterase [Acidaminobacter sp. JC074]MCH4889522.1 EAL domain-containing protein [Acidaminobacter sp. JC074]
MKDYNKLLQARVDKKFNNVLIATTVVASIASVILFVADLPIIYGVLNLMTALIMFVFSIIADKIPTSYKIIGMIFVTSVISIASYVGGAFTSAFITLLALSNVIAVLFLRRKQSIFISFASIGLMLSLCAYSVITNGNEDLLDPVLTWGLQIVAYILFVVVLQISVYATKRYLMENIEALENAVSHSEKLAYFDQLTGLPNANKFEKDVVLRIENQKRNGFIVLVNLKSLRSINSTLGQDFGDQALKSSAEIIDSLKLRNTIVARVSSSEFAIWVDHINEAGLQLMISDMMKKIKEKSFDVKKKLEFYVSYADFVYGTDSFVSCLQKATLTLAYVKDHNILEHTGYKEDMDLELRRKELLKDLVVIALENREFTLHYQEKYDLRTNQVIGVEALARWHHKELGYVSPIEFIPIIESLNMSKAFGECVIEQTCKDYKMLKMKYNNDITISVNISPSHIIDESIVETILDTLKVYGVPYQKYIVEITEDIMIEGIDKVIPIVNALRKMKVKISLDDFGTGYSSLNYLTQLSLDELKIDKSFVDQIGSNNGIEYLLENIIRLSKQFELDLIAEGVETIDQLHALDDLGCYHIQGYYYSKPEALY